LSREELTKKQAIANGLTIFSTGIRQRLSIEFAELSDEEVICYILCSCMGWSYNRAAKVLRLSNPTVKDRDKNARNKRKL